MKSPSPPKKGPRLSPDRPQTCRRGSVLRSRSPPKSVATLRSRSPPKSNIAALSEELERERTLAVLGHSMISRSGDPESELTGINLDLRLITGRMAQTLNTFEVRDSSAAKAQIDLIEEHLGEISDGLLKSQIKGVLDDYKRLATERESILSTLENWFVNCHDEFLEELLDFESQFDGEETLSDNINQAKDIIAKIKFINGKIVEFQGNGMSTKQLIAQKKNLEDELMKKKVIVDNTQVGTEAYTAWKTNVDNLLSMIKESSANDIEKALLDMKLSEAAEQINSTIISLERTARRVGVLFKNVKELEYSNGQLAEENSFLKQRLSKVDKHFKDVMTKKVKKLDNTLNEVGDIKHLTTTGRGSTPDDVDRQLQRQGNAGLSIEMEMIDNYQMQIHALDNENKELISKFEAADEELDDCKEEIITLEKKLIDVQKKSAIAAEHPLVKLDTGEYTGLHSTSSNSGSLSDGGMNGNMTREATGTGSFKIRKNTFVQEQRRGSMVSTIMIQDGKELDALKLENDQLRQQIGKLKTTLNVKRRRESANIVRKLNRASQTKALCDTSDDDQQPESEKKSTEAHEDQPENEEETGEGTEYIPNKKVSDKKVKKKKPKKIKTARKSVPEVVSDQSSSPESSESESTQDVTKNDKDPAAMVGKLRSYVEKQDRDKRRSLKKKAKEAKKLKRDILENQKQSDITKSETESELSLEESDDDSDGKPSESVVTPPKTKPIIKDKKRKRKREPKPKVQFEVEAEEDSEPVPSFERVPTPKIETEDKVVTLEKIKEEMSDFLSYGEKFICSIIDCLSEAGDDELAINMNQYSELEQKIVGLESSLNILLYGIDLGMYLVTPSQVRPEYSPIPFENKLYFQENLSKYLREKYPKLNVNAMKMFDPDLDPQGVGPKRMKGPSSPSFKPYTEFRSQKQGLISNFMMAMPLTTTPEPKPRKPTVRIQKRKAIKKIKKVGKIEEIMAALTAGTMMGNTKHYSNEAKQLLDERTFAEIVDHVMPKEIAMEYLKLVQPTHDTLGKRQYNEKLKRGVLKVKDLLDLVNINSNQGVMKGMPPNKLGEPRSRQTKVHQTNLVVSDLIGQSSTLNTQFNPSPAVENYRNKLARHDERVRASLEDYAIDQEELVSSNSLTVIEVPLTSRGFQDRRFTGRSSSSKIDEKAGPKEEMFHFSSSTPNMDHAFTQEKRSFLPVVTQNLLPHSESNKKSTLRTKKAKKTTSQPPLLDQTPPKVSDILNLDWGVKPKPKFSSSVGKLPSIHASNGISAAKVDENQSFP